MAKEVLIPEVAQVLKKAECLVYNRKHSHTAIVSWSEHVPCMITALQEAGYLPPVIDDD